MALESDIAVLANIDLFTELNDEQLKLMAFSSQKESYPEGAEVFREGEEADCGFVVMSGEVRVVSQVSETRSQSRVIGEGGLLGELALLTKLERAGTATVIEDAELLKINREIMHRILEEYPEVAVRMYRKIAGNLSQISEELDSLYRRLPAKHRT